MAKTLTLGFVTPDRQVAQENVHEVQLPALDGYVGILPGHAPLLTALGRGELSFKKDGQTFYATVLGGFAEVLPDRVIVLAETAERAQDIDIERARNAHEKAKQRLRAKGEGNADWASAAEALERARIRLLVAEHGGSAATLLASRSQTKHD